MRKDAKLSSTVPSITLKTSKNQFAIFISLALRHETRNKTHHKSEKKEQLLVAQQIEVLKPGKKEKIKTTKKNTICELCIHLSTSIPKTSSLSYHSLTSTFEKKWIPSGKLTWRWNIPVFNRKYIFNPGPFLIAMLVYRSVIQYFTTMSVFSG